MQKFLLKVNQMTDEEKLEFLLKFQALLKEYDIEINAEDYYLEVSTSSYLSPIIIKSDAIYDSFLDHIIEEVRVKLTEKSKNEP